MTSDLVEEVARALATSKVRPSFIYQDAARAAIAIVLKRAAEVAGGHAREFYSSVDVEDDYGLGGRAASSSIVSAILSLGEQEGRDEGN